MDNAAMHYFNPTIETMPREHLQAGQLARLKSMLSFLNNRNQFYTDKWTRARVAPYDLQSLSDLKKLPFTTKEELVQAQYYRPLSTNTTFPETAYTRYHHTSGSTGAPLHVFDTPESWDWWGKCWGHVLAGAGLDSTDRIFMAFSFGPFIGFWAAVEGARQIGAMMIPGGGWDSMQRLVYMRDLQATAICCTPTYALRLAESAREQGFNLKSIPIRATIHAGEPGANVPHTKARIQEMWGAKCFDHAGASEVGAHSFECEAQPNGIHLIESEFIAEVIDPTSHHILPPGKTGELVLTNLGRLGFPVIRYRTGDLVCLNMEPCVCGRTFARFDGGLLGRCDDMVIIRGVNVLPAALENLIRQVKAVDEFRVTLTDQREMKELEVEIEVTDRSDPENARESVEQAILHSLSLRARVTVAPRGTLPRFEMKAQRFVKVRSAARTMSPKP
jgi:phenylacetate-CoA ligase